MNNSESPRHRSPISSALILTCASVEEDAGVCPEAIGIDFHIDEIERVCEQAQNLVGLLPEHP